MAEEFAEYARFFTVGLRVEVGIPVSTDETFRDWAVVNEFHDDHIVVEMSRDQLPRRVRVEYGSILDVGVWRGEEVYTCRAIVTEKISARSLKMRLLGSVTLKDRRQFYRLNVGMRLRYSLPKADVTPAEIRLEWEELRQQEMEAFRARTGDYDAAYVEVLKRLRGAGGRPQPEWHDRSDIRAVIGGGGVGFRMHRRMRPEDLVWLELHLPLYPFRIVHTVAEVVYVLEPFRVSGPETLFHTGMRFHHIDERDRDHIIEFISQAELERLRTLSDRRPIKEVDEARLEQDVKKASRRYKLLNVLFLILFVLSIFLLIRFIVVYKSTFQENPIGSEFDKSLGR